MKLKKRIFELEGQRVQYLTDVDTGHCSLILLPEGKESVFEERREWLNIPEMIRIGMDKRAWEVGSLCHVSFDSYARGKGAGETLKYGPATAAMKFHNQTVKKTGTKTEVITTMLCEKNVRIKHYVQHKSGDKGIIIHTELSNESDRDISLELLTSVSLDNLSPFAEADAQERMILHRFYGGWSLEGKHREDFFEDLNLERSWMCAFPESERFGSVSSYPVHRYFPMAIVEDRKEGVFWGIQLEAPGAWQMEVSRDGDCYSFSAGIVDVEFGGWRKTIHQGEIFRSTKAYVSVGGSLDEVCQNLLNMHRSVTEHTLECEKELPIIFNDWCASYGEPTHEKTLRYMERLRGTPVKYIVIDAGWTKTVEKSFGQGGNGDWKYDKEKFPYGLKTLSKIVQENGFRLGIWFEPEVTTVGAETYNSQYDFMHLKNNGVVINSGGDRTFWDFRRDDVRSYLTEHVTHFLKENEITYLKIDYNASIGAGCDGAESPGEGLRKQMEAVQDFFRELSKENPGLVIENCASGGHRLEASFIDLTSMSSFSDAHECIELPCIAANLQRLVPVTKNQIWVVVNDYLSIGELYYRLASGFLGRFCLSGNIDTLSEEKWQITRTAMDFYQQVVEILKYGETHVKRENFRNIHHPKGVQIVERTYRDYILIVMHCFSGEGKICCCLGEKKIKMIRSLGRQEIIIETENGTIQITNMQVGDGVVLLVKEG